MSDPLLAIRTSRSDAESVIKLAGDCDFSNVEDLDRTIHEVLVSEHRRIVFDVEELDFMASCALTPIERAIERLEGSGGVVVVRKPSRMARWLLDFFGISAKAVIE